VETGAVTLFSRRTAVSFSHNPILDGDRASNFRGAPSPVAARAKVPIRRPFTHGAWKCVYVQWKRAVQTRSSAVGGTCYAVGPTGIRPRRKRHTRVCFGPPERLVAEIIDAELVTQPRPASPHALAAPLLGADLGAITVA
jgi:hypothetical protein